jgi:hypothetical protein
MLDAHYDPALLRKALRTSDRLTVAQLKAHVLQTMTDKPLNGSTAATLLEVDGRFPILLVGERHDNPSLCANQEPVFDVVKHIILKALRECPRAYLFLESFFHFLSDDPQTMAGKLEDMEQAYGVREVVRCIADEDFRCQYEKQRGALTLLRCYKSIAQAVALAGRDENGACPLTARILIFDVREDLGMQNPWDLDNVKSREEVARRIHQSLARRREVTKYMRPVARPEWQAAFDREVLSHYMDMGDRAATLEEYRAYFVEIPDAVALNRLLALWATQGPDCFPIFFMGDKHRENMLRLLRKMGCFALDVLAAAKDPAFGSCARPVRA